MPGDGKSTVSDRPRSSTPPDDDAARDDDAREDDAREPRDEKSTALERPPSGGPQAPGHAIGSRAPAGEDPRRASRPSARRSIAPGGARYTGGDEIGRGGMGRVVEATDTLLDRRVAVKEALTTDPELLRRFARETKITARLEHPSIVPVYDAGSVDGAPFYVMRRVSGRPLSELIRNAPTLNERLALVPHVLAAAQAIAHAHQRGIIHRDIKPSNILVGELGETVVIDWGLAKVIGEPDDDGRDAKEPDASSSLRTRIGAVFGTPGFMAPDALRGEPVGPQGDVYSLGASLYNLLAAEPPHYADDSTQMMMLATQGPATPIARLVPGVPAELSTIVDRATAYDVTRRYQDAGAFAEELQRFLAGQLVASHRYSRTERFVRFVRKHRAAVAAVSAATVIVIVVGTFAVSQVVEERDRADAQARLAKQGQHEAEVARAMADERADQLLISRAKALVETNPTAALASLKQLSPASKQIDEARAIIASARMRGVAWAMKADDGHTSFATLDPSALRIAQLTLDGKLHVYDLAARRKTFSAQAERGTQVRWILGGERLLVAGRGPTRTFDLAGAEQASDLPALAHLETDEGGRMVIAVDSSGRALHIDAKTHATTVLGERVTDIAISRDGVHCAVVTADELVVFDAALAPILRRKHAATIGRVVFGETKVAALDDFTIIEAPLAKNAAWTELKLGDRDPGVRPYWIEFSNERLFASYTDATVVVATSRGGLREIGRIDSAGGSMQPFGGEFLTVGTDGRRIFYTDGARMHTLYLPIALRYIRIIGRASHRRLVALGDGAIIVLELETLPQRLPIEMWQKTSFIDDRTLMSSNSYNYDYGWLDLATRRTTRVKLPRPANLHSYDRHESRMLVIEGGPAGRRAVVVGAGHETPDEFVDAPFEEIQLIGGFGIVYSFGNKVYGGFDRAPTRPELFATDGSVRIIVRLGGSRFAVVTQREIVRGDLKTAAIERLPLDDGPLVQYALGHGDALVFARGDTIWRWGTTLTELAKVEAPVEYMYPGMEGVVATLKTHSTLFVGFDGKVTRLASTRGGVLVSPRRVIVAGQFQYDVLEMPSFVRWSLPITRATTSENQLDLAPNGTLLAEKSQDGRVWLWQLPAADDDLTKALGATNLTEDRNGLLLWPWQHSDPTR